MLKPIFAALLLATAPAAFAQQAQALQAPQQAKAPATPAAGQPASWAFSLPALPYASDALAPVIDKATMDLHHGKHHQAYVDNLNKAVSADAALQGLTLEQLMARVSTLPKAIRNNGGGHWNHSFFWDLMAPQGQRGEPSPRLTAAIEKQFGSMDRFKAAFQQAGTGQFGSGWAWLIVKPDGTLSVTSTANQDNPLMDDAAEKGRPILANDVWEHAYYLTYNNRRGEYLGKWWEVVNWGRVNALYDEAVARKP